MAQSAAKEVKSGVVVCLETTTAKERVQSGEAQSSISPSQLTVSGADGISGQTKEIEH